MTNLFNTGIRPAIDAHLLKLAEEKRDYGGYWSASSAGYCMRKLIFERLGVPHVSKEDDARKQRVFTSGHIFHEWIQKLTKDAGLSIASEVELQDEDLMVRGHFDDLVLIRFDENGETPVRVGAEQRAQHLILYDYKTVNSQAFKYKTDKMSHYHKMQLGTYLYMLRNLKPGDKVSYENGHLFMDKLGEFSTEGKNWVSKLTEARILLISKDDLRMAEQQLLWTPQLEKAVVGFWKTLNGYWERKVIPSCTCADYEGGFMSREKFNPYYYNDQPCSIDWYNKWKSEKKA